MRLLGRQAECRVLEALADGVRGGRSQVLVVRGEAGIGKTALLDHVAAASAGARVLRAAGVESERELAFGGLHQLCAPLLDRLGHLPEPQRNALGTAFGLDAGEPPDRFMVGMAVLNLLADAAVDEPQICLVDDVQWFDQVSAQTLAFVARRAVIEPIGFVFAVREPSGGAVLGGLPELELTGLGRQDSRQLLESAVPGRLDQRVRDRILAETRGNPLALLELPRGLSPAEIAGGFAIPDPSTLTSRIERGFHRRLLDLPAPTQTLLLTAAAEPLGDVTLLWRAAGILGIDPEAATAAEGAGLVELGTRVRFRHPLVRSAVYRASSASARREVHRALAEATDPLADPERRAWHLAEAVTAPDEPIAVELERSARRAQARGGFAAAAAFLDRAAALTGDATLRSTRMLGAAQAHCRAGAFEAALELLDNIEGSALEEIDRARIELLRAQVIAASSRGNKAPRLLLAAATRLQPLDLTLARTTFLEALSATFFAGRFANDTNTSDVARAACDLPSPPSPSLGDELLDGLARLHQDGYTVAVPQLRQTIRRFCSEELTGDQGLRWLWHASITAADLWDEVSWRVLSSRHVEVTRETGALSDLPIALNSRAYVHLFAGELAAARALIDEAQLICETTGTDQASYAALALAAFRGHAEQATDLIDTSMREVVPRGEGIGLTVIQWATALLYNGLGRHEQALVAGLEASTDPRELAVGNWGLAEVVEAAVRTGETRRAFAALDQLAEMTRACGTNWALGVEARSRALVAGRGAEEHHQRAISLLDDTHVRVDRARAHLLYGEFLRRHDRRTVAREQLRTAHQLFSSMGLAGFAERARLELLRCGESVSSSRRVRAAELTLQEARIARLAGEGLTNPEIGAQLFLSPHTVDWHLRKVFAKLGISSRRQIAERLPHEVRAEGET